MKYPEENFISARNGNHTKWYRSDGHHRSYISKKDRTLAQELAIKKYLVLLLDELAREQQAVEAYLKIHNSINYKSSHLLHEDSAYYELLSPYFQTKSTELQQWAKQEYIRNPKNPEGLTNHSSSGNIVRSKSEALIDMTLFMNKIPFRYECQLIIGKHAIYPDFTIRHPDSGDLFYWEHFGMMDDPDYSRSAYDKLKLYTSNGIIPSINLITTYETKDHPLDMRYVEDIINHYFL